MPKRRERMAGYVRESDPTLADSTTIESQAKAVRQYGEKQGYIYDISVHEYKEAVSAYSVAYFQRLELMEMLGAAERREFDVLVITEVRALSRKGAGEVFIIYEMLQKYGVRLETITERFSDDAGGELALSNRATNAKLEREQSYLRMQRGKKDRIEIGNAPNGHPKPAYGYIFVDGKTEQKGRYEFNLTTIHIDSTGTKWSEYTVVLFIFDLRERGTGLGRVADILNELGVPPPHQAYKYSGAAHWQRGTIHRILSNPIYTGEVWANRYKSVKSARTGKLSMVLRPRSEWVLLPEGTAPAVVSKETFEAVQRQMECNREDSYRNKSHPKEELGLLRSGFIFCGVCGNRMHVAYPTQAQRLKGANPWYACHKKNGTTPEQGRHRTQIHIPHIDALVRERINEALSDPVWVRRRVEELRTQTRLVVQKSAVEETIAAISRAIQNLCSLAEQATDNQTIASLTRRMLELEERKREVESLLNEIADEEEIRGALGEEISKFETWAEEAKPFLTDSAYIPSYDELRLAVRILGLQVTVFPTTGDWPYRYSISVPPLRS